MPALIPATKANEVIDIFGAPGLKNLKSFSEIGKKKAELKKAMNSLLSKNEVEAHTGLGIIYIYENLIDLALSHFRQAYLKSKFGLNEATHYANALFINGYFEDAIPIYLEMIKNNRNDTQMFIQVAKRFNNFCFEQELNKVIELSYVSRDIPELELNIIKTEMNSTLTFLKRFNIPVELYREIRSWADVIFYRFFTLPTTGDFELNFDIDNLSYIFGIDSEYCSDSISLVSKMNDQLQDAMIEAYEKYDVKLGSEQDRITAYFNFV
ncbi:MAG: tetratricopeptide repeat protein [Acinetobacter sp.]